MDNRHRLVSLPHGFVYSGLAIGLDCDRLSFCRKADLERWQREQGTPAWPLVPEAIWHVLILILHLLRWELRVDYQTRLEGVFDRSENLKVSFCELQRPIDF